MQGRVMNAWGMTETSPACTFGIPKPEHDVLPQRIDYKTHAGRCLFGVEMRIVDDAGVAQPFDGVAQGEIHVRGPWIASGYYEDADATSRGVTADGWLRTGDIASIDPDGYVAIRDRAKDVIKSGGEWISSIDLENVAVAHPDVAEAAAIGVPHPTWSERPVLFVGHGVTLSEASGELTELARTLGIPVIASPNGFGCLDMADPLSLGFIGRNGAYPANEAGRHADLVVAVGARFDDRSASSWLPGYSWNFPHCKLIHVDVDPDEIGRNYPPDLGVLADARTFLRQLLGELERRPAKRDALKAWHADIKQWQADWDAYTRPNFAIHASPIRPERVVADCQKVLPETAILACDVGVNHNWYMQFWKARRPQTMLNSWGFSGMGFGTAGALGAKLAAPERPVVAIAGDGCFTMVPHVLCTAVEYDIPVVWLIWNNFSWASIRDIQYGMFGGREIGTAFYRGSNNTPYNPDFAAWARAAGAEGVTISKSEDLRGALEHAIASNKPFVLDVHVDANVHPPATGAWQLPPTPYNEPVFGRRFLPSEQAPVK